MAFDISPDMPVNAEAQNMPAINKVSMFVKTAAKMKMAAIFCDSFYLEY